MKTQNEPEKPDEKSLKDLKNYLQENHKPEKKPVKPPEMTPEQEKSFINDKIMPVLREIEKQFEGLNFKNVRCIPFTRLATIRILDDFIQFHFKVKVCNLYRVVDISYEIKYRKTRMAKLISAENIPIVSISFNEIDTINSEMITALFTKWFIEKDEYLKDKINRAKDPTVIFYQHPPVIKNKTESS